MLSDYWIITQILIQIISWVLLLGMLNFSFQMLRHWSLASTDELQIHLERKSYLIGAVLQMVMWFQIISLLIFLQTVNVHLPGIVKGAMCATGVLGVQDNGFVLLYLKLIALMVYIVFLHLNYLDNTQADYPLSPMKYWVVFPAFGLITMDLFLTFNFFKAIEPNVIATCCSADFIASADSGITFLKNGMYLHEAMWVFVGSFMILLATQLFQLVQKRVLSNKTLAILQMLTALLFIFSAVYTLKYFFVRYIYALPLHNCLFDIFFSKYYFIGYGIFGAYFGVSFCMLFQLIYAFTKEKLSITQIHTLRNYHFYTILWSSFAFFIPIVYWMMWKGEM